MDICTFQIISPIKKWTIEASFSSKTFSCSIPQYHLLLPKSISNPFNKLRENTGEICEFAGRKKNSHYSFPSFSFKEVSLLSSILLDSHSSLEIISSESLWLFCLLFHLLALQGKQNSKAWYNFNLYRALKVVGALIFTDVSFISGLPTQPFNSLCSKFGQIPKDFFPSCFGVR